MRAKDDFGALIHDTIDGGQSRADTGVIGNLQRFIERDVEISPDDDPLTTKLHIVDRFCASSCGVPSLRFGKCGNGVDGLFCSLLDHP